MSNAEIQATIQTLHNQLDTFQKEVIIGSSKKLAFQMSDAGMTKTALQFTDSAIKLGKMAVILDDSLFILAEFFPPEESQSRPENKSENKSEDRKEDDK